MIKRLEDHFLKRHRRERIWILAKTDFRKRYNDSVLGLLWALLNPLFRAGIYYFAFSFIRSERFENFVVYLFGGIIIWMFFSESTNKSITLLKTKRYLIENIRFNWIDIQIANVTSVFLGLLFNIIAYFFIMFISGIMPGSKIFLLPIFLVNLWVMTFSFSLLISSISIYFKDIQHIWSMVILAGFWSAPIILFTIEDICNAAPALAYIHPITAILVNIRNVTMYDLPIDTNFLIWGWCYSLILLLISVLIFKKVSVKAIENL